jgi:hypothetical protein
MKDIELPEVWTMRDGTKVKIKDMKNSHIHNCIKMLNMYIEKELDDISFLSTFHSNGEQAQIELDRAYDEALDKGGDLKAMIYIEALERELKRRQE